MGKCWRWGMAWDLWRGAVLLHLGLPFNLLGKQTAATSTTISVWIWGYFLYVDTKLLVPQVDGKPGFWIYIIKVRKKIVQRACKTFCIGNEIWFVLGMSTKERSSSALCSFPCLRLPIKSSFIFNFTSICQKTTYILRSRHINKSLFQMYLQAWCC